MEFTENSKVPTIDRLEAGSPQIYGIATYDASTIETTEVKKAFEMAKISKFPSEVRIAYQNEDLEYDRYSEHTQKLVDKTILEAKLKIASKLLAMNDKVSELDIAEITGLSVTDLSSLKFMGKTIK